MHRSRGQNGKAIGLIQGEKVEVAIGYGDARKNRQHRRPFSQIPVKCTATYATTGPIEASARSSATRECMTPATLPADPRIPCHGAAAKN
jgi:hypothetical protein